MNSMSAENGEAGIYIIDQDYRIIYLNHVAKSYYSNLEVGMYCYQGMGKESCPCTDCPGTGRNSGHVIFYNTASKLWLDVSSGEIDWPGSEGCRLIMFRPVSEKNKNIEETDSMTGLFRYGPFFERAEQLLKKQTDTKHFMVAIDIEHFKLFNEWYGEEEGDRFLIKIGNHLKAAEQSYDTVAGYMGGDDFVIILPADLSILKGLEDEINDYARQYKGNAGFLPAFGICRIEDLSLPVSMIYDRAAIALNSVKGNYTKRIGWYDPGMKQKMENDQVLLSEIQRALEKREFIFYAQPQCNMLTGKIIGLESLVRWRHPVRGMVSPGDFIPLLEKNGFITYLDLYIWEMVCRQLSIWTKRGRRLVPISVNMSRMDIYAIDVVAKFKELVDRYEIDPKFLEIEITESAYAEDYDLIRKVVEDLRKAGFPVFMDDFGSGYSSLNMLKDVNVDVIKIDTKFLDMNENSRSRGMGILETIVRMARVMQLKVIAEGVEEKEQVDFLINIGCIYGQGYYYYKPLTIAEVDLLLTEEDNVDYRGIQARQMRQLKLEDLFNENITSEAMLNNMLGAIALYEVYEDHYEVLRVNEEYYRVTGDNPVDMEERRRYMLNKVYKDDIDWVLNIFENAYSNPIHGAEGIFRRYRSSGELMWVHLRAFFLREQDERRLYYGSVRDATEQMEQRQKLEDSQKILGDVLKLAGRNISFENIAQENQWAASAIFAQAAPSGLLGIYCEKGFPLYFANNEMLRLLEYDSYEVFAKDIGGKIADLIHPEDLKLIQENILRYISPGMEYTFRYRMRKRDGSWLWLVTKGRVVQAEDGRMAIVSACMDITDTVLAQKKLQDTNEVLRFKNDELEFLSSGMPGGYFRCRKSEKMELLYISLRFMEILDYTKDELEERFHGHFVDMIHPADRERVRKLVEALEPEENLRGVEYRVLSKHGYIWILCHSKLTVKDDGSFLYGVMLNIDEIVDLRRQVEDSRKMMDQIDRLTCNDPDLPAGIPNRQAAVIVMGDYLSRRRFLPSALVLFEFCRPVDKNEKIRKTGKKLFAKYLERLKSLFREDDIFCLNGEYEVMVLCKNIRDNDMENKLKRIVGDLKQEIRGEGGKALHPVNAGYVMIEIQNRDFNGCYDKARSALDRARQMTGGGCVKQE